jgi:hypothetical protein
VNAFVEQLWANVGGDPDLLANLTISGPSTVLPSVYDVTGWAAATIGAATLAAAELDAVRCGQPVASVEVDTHHACAAFISEALFEADGWTRDGGWDSIAGDYEAADGWIRLHTNYSDHREAALRVLGCEPTADAVAAAVRVWARGDLESAVVGEGGASAAMHDHAGWSTHEHGRVAGAEAVVWGHGRNDGSASDRLTAAGSTPLADVRVLDLTRVIAGPQCTRFLAAMGADVLRIDPPGFAEMPALLVETTAGKRTASLDLSTDEGRSRFDALVAESDVLVHGLRPGALDGLGLTVDRLTAANPALVVAQLDAYGWRGPWAARRGFDSLVQMSTGIAARGMAVYRTDRPRPLPAQALDHGAGFSLAAGVCRALTTLLRDGRALDVRGSLVGAANELTVREVDDPNARVEGWPDALFESVQTAWGSGRRVAFPARIDGRGFGWSIQPGPLGRDEPVWP